MLGVESCFLRLVTAAFFNSVFANYSFLTGVLWLNPVCGLLKQTEMLCVKNFKLILNLLNLCKKDWSKFSPTEKHGNEGKKTCFAEPL